MESESKIYWTIPKGKKTTEENAIQCALRELKEETGIEIEESALCNYFLLSNDTIIYLAKIKNQLTANADGKEISKAEWFSKSQLNHLPIRANVEKRIKHEIERLELPSHEGSLPRLPTVHSYTRCCGCLLFAEKEKTILLVLPKWSLEYSRIIHNLQSTNFNQLETFSLFKIISIKEREHLKEIFSNAKEPEFPQDLPNNWKKTGQADENRINGFWVESEYAKLYWNNANNNFKIINGNYSSKPTMTSNLKKPQQIFKLNCVNFFTILQDEEQ